MLVEKMKRLAELNLAHEVAKKEIEEAEKVLHALPEYLVLGEKSDAAQKIRDEIADLRKEINSLTLDIYEKTGDKHPFNGVGIRVGTVYEYAEKTAFDYCLNELPEALKLDKSIFEKFVKGVQDVRPLNFVTVKEKITPTIASDLSDYLD